MELIERLFFKCVSIDILCLDFIKCLYCTACQNDRTDASTDYQSNTL